MKRNNLLIIALLLSLMMLTACGGNKALVGKWKPDRVETEETSIFYLIGQRKAYLGIWQKIMGGDMKMYKL